MAFGPGSIAFVGFNADATDNLAFVVLEDMPAGTVINFTDNAWNETAFNTTENHWSWTAGSDIVAGTVVTMDNLATASPSSNLGAIAFSTAATRDIGTSTESVWAYVGEVSSPTFLAAITNNGFVNSNSGSLVGTGLAEGITAINMASKALTADIGAYLGPRAAASISDLLALINNPANWAAQNSGADNTQDGVTPDLPFSTTPFVADPTAQQISFTSDSVAISHVEGDAGTTTVFTFTVQRINGTTGEVNFSGTLTPGAGFDGADIAGGAYPTAFSGTIAEGATTGTVSIVVLGDFAKEADESFQLRITSAANTTGEAVFAAGQTQASGTIVNNDIQEGMPLGVGSIAFVGYSAEGNSNLSFVVLADIAAGTVIHFTDNEWNGSVFNTGENHWSWTASSDIAKGTVVNMDDLATSPTSNLGTIGYSTLAARGLDLQAESIYAYTGSASAPAFLAGISSADFQFSVGTLDNTGLVLGQTALALVPSHSFGSDIAMYNGTRTGMQSYADFLAAINNAANWISQETEADDSHDGIGPDAPFSTAPFVPNLGTQLLSFAPGSVTVAQVESDAGTTTTYTFTVQRTNGTTGVVNFSGTLTPGTGMNAADFGGTLPLAFSGTIAEGAATGTVTITVSGDITLEADESFVLKLTAASSTPGEVLITGETQATGTIVNNDTQFQTLAFTADSAVVREEGPVSTSSTYTFTVVRDSREGNLTFTAQLENSFDSNLRVDADDFGGILPTTFTGTIPDGQSSATFSITVTGDDRFEANETFGLVLTGGITDGGIAGVPSSNYSESHSGGTIRNDDFIVHGGETILASANLTGADHLVIENGGSLDGALSLTGTNVDIVIDNHGQLSSQYFGGASGSLEINNHADGHLLGDAANFSNISGIDVVINNDGLMNGFEEGVLASGKVVNNSSTGVITAVVKDKVFALRAGVVNNHGEITGGEDAVGAEFIHNYAGGLIQGARHAATGGVRNVVNEAGGRMVGLSGSAVNVDNVDAQESSRVTVTNYGIMIGGRPLAGDGDAIDVDGLLTLHNYGYVGGEGGYGYHDGEPNVSEGIAIGGGIINNYAGGEIYGYGRAIQIDNSGNSDAPAAATITNAGLIRGDGHPPEGVSPAEVALFAARIKSGEAINIEGSFADSLTNGASGQIIGGVRMGGGNDTLDNDGTMTATGGSAVDLGDGDDLFVNRGTITGAVLLGAGADELINVSTGVIDGAVSFGDGSDKLGNSGRIVGSIDMGAGDDVINLYIGSDATAGILLGTGDDRLTADSWPGHAITVDGGDGDDQITTARGNDIVEGGEGDDLIYANEGDDVVDGGAGDDHIIGGDGADTLRGGEGNDRIEASTGDIVDGGDGIDTLELSGTGNGSLAGVSGFEKLVVHSGGWAIADASDFSEATVNSGATLVTYGDATDTTIAQGGTHYVWGTATGSAVSGQQIVGSGAAATETLIASGGEQIVHTGGVSSATVIAGGDQAVYGSATQTTVGDGGQQSVYGSATGTTVGEGGTQAVYADGTAIGTTLNAGGTQIDWGTASDTTINGGAQYVWGTAAGTTISSGVQYVEAGGTANATTINGGGEQVIHDGGVSNLTTILGGDQAVYGSADQTTVGDGGLQSVHGSVTGTLVNGGGEQSVHVNGVATGTTLNAGGVQINWGTAIDTTINGGNQYVWGTASGTTIVSGTQYVVAGGFANDTTIDSGGLGYVHTGGTLHDVTFAGAGGTLVLDEAAAFSGEISGWEDGDRIALGDVDFGESTTLAYVANAGNTGGTLTVSDGSHVATLELLGQYTAADFALSSDGHGGTLISDPGTPVQAQNVLAPSLYA